jgi:hypothetical protein
MKAVTTMNPNRCVRAGCVMGAEGSAAAVGLDRKVHAFRAVALARLERLGAAKVHGFPHGFKLYFFGLPFEPIVVFGRVQQAIIHLVVARALVCTKRVVATVVLVTAQRFFGGRDEVADRS